MADLLKVQHDEWAKLRRELRDLQAQVRQVALQPLAIVAGGVQVYATLVDLPAAGQFGRLAAVTATHRLYFDDGTAWREVTLV